jgi:hypothetical protein
MIRTLCVLHAWRSKKPGDRCPMCAQAKPMDPTAPGSDRAYTMTLALIQGRAITPEQAELLRDRLAGYGGGEG